MHKADGRGQSKSALLSGRKVEVKARRRQQLAVEAEQAAAPADPVQAVITEVVGPEKFRRRRRVHLKNVSDKYQRKPRDPEPATATAGRQDQNLLGDEDQQEAVVRQEQDPLGLLSSIDDEDGDDADASDIAATVRNANEVWMEIQKMDARFHQLQQRQAAGRSLDVAGDAMSCGCLTTCVSYILWPFTECYRSVRESVLETDGMQKYLYQRGYKVYGTDPRVDLYRADFEALLLHEGDVGFL